MSEHTCRANGNSLVVTGDFSKDTDTGFDAACQQILGCTEKEVLIDLTATSNICSMYVGLLAELCLSARNKGKQVIIRSAPKIHKVLAGAGLDHAAALEEVG
jgi:anti-anti-sigma regulatory factor